MQIRNYTFRLSMYQW